jgi:hypothetical protein
VLGGALLSPLGKFFIILRDAKHYRLGVNVFHLHSDRASCGRAKYGNAPETYVFAGS